MGISQVNYWLGLGRRGGSSVVGVAGVVLEAPGSGPRMEVADVLQPGSAGGVARAIPVGADAQVEAATDFVHGGGLPGLLTGGLLAQGPARGRDPRRSLPRQCVLPVGGIVRPDRLLFRLQRHVRL